jgi:hypothetical protein
VSDSDIDNDLMFKCNAALWEKYFKNEPKSL